MTQEYNQKYISFAVGSKHGPRSSSWIVDVSKEDVYVRNTLLGPHMHASLHKSGQWHIKGFTKNNHKKLSILTRSHRNAVPIGKYPVGLYILVPDCSLRPASDVDCATKANIWLERPPYDGTVEIAIMSWDVTRVFEEWPGKAAGTQLVADYKAENHRVVGLLMRALTPDHPVSTSVKSLLAPYKNIRKFTLDSPERRGLISTTTVDGALGLVEVAID